MQRELIIIVVAILSGCGRHSAGIPPAPELPASMDPVSGCRPAKGTSSSSLITAGELQSTRAANLYDVIRLLRPAYFDTLSPSAIFNDPGDPIVVISNRHVIGGVDQLRGMDAAGLLCVRRLAAADVMLLTGTSSWSDGIELVGSHESRVVSHDPVGKR